jgi:aspartyl-tRNA synthetase
MWLAIGEAMHENPHNDPDAKFMSELIANLRAEERDALESIRHDLNELKTEFASLRSELRQEAQVLNQDIHRTLWRLERPLRGISFLVLVIAIALVIHMVNS